MDLSVLVTVINATGNPINAALMLLGEYKSPELEGFASGQLHSFNSENVEYSEMKLVKYNPLSNPDNCITYTGYKTVTIYFKNHDIKSVETYNKGYKNSNTDYSVKPTEEYVWKHEFVEEVNSSCSLTRWQEFMSRNTHYFDAD